MAMTCQIDDITPTKKDGAKNNFTATAKVSNVNDFRRKLYLIIIYIFSLIPHFTGVILESHNS